MARGRNRKIAKKTESAGVSRRGFLQTVAGVGAGLTAQWVLPAASGLALPDTAPMPDPPLHPGFKYAPPTPRIEAHVHINQIGFLPGEPKRAVIPANAPISGGAFSLIDDDVIPETRYHGTLTQYMADRRYGHFEHHYFADFNDFSRPGRYRLRLSDGRLSAPFSVAENTYTRLTPLILRYFDIQCCGTARTDLRQTCHKDDGIVLGGPRNGQPFDASGGWHDAGDYLKFVETTSYVTALMLFAYDNFPKAFPEKVAHGHLPLLLDHARVGLEWLLKMHPRPDEFYYQVGDSTDHDTWRLPEADCVSANALWKPRPVYYGIGANLAGRTAAAFATAARLYKHYDHTFAGRCLAAAQTVFALGLKNPQVLTTEPANFYPEKTWQDDMEWGAAALFLATGREEYRKQALQFAEEAGAARDVTSVYNTHALAHYTLYHHAPQKARERLLSCLRLDAEYTKKRATNPYGLGSRYAWGTTDEAAGAALTCLIYASLSKEKEYENIARHQRDFILGCNPFGICCLIGAGTRYPLFPHHQIANIQNIELAGAIVGGPADFSTVKNENITLTDAEFDTQTLGPPLAADLPDAVAIYHDAVQDYVTNEPANDYTANFLLLTAFYNVPA